MKWSLRILALAGTTVFGVLSICWVVVDTWFYIQIYKVFHKFPIYRLESDLKDLAPDVLAFVFCGILYLYLVRKMRQMSN